MSGSSGRAYEHEEYLDGIRECLVSKPASRRRLEYDEWAGRATRHRTSDQS